MSKFGHLSKTEKHILKSLKLRHPADKLTLQPNEPLPELELEMKLCVANGDVAISLPCIETIVIGDNNDRPYQSIFAEFGALLDKITKNPTKFEKERIEQYSEYS